MIDPAKEPKKGFPSSLTTPPRAFTAAAMLLVAAGITGFLVACGGSGEDAARAELIRQADRFCGNASDRLGRMPPVYISNYGEVVPLMAKNERVLAGRLKALETLEENRPSIGRLVRLLDRQSNEVDEVSVAYMRGPNFAAYRRHLQRVRGLDDKIAAAARSLGATACAKSPVRTRYL